MNRIVALALVCSAVTSAAPCFAQSAPAPAASASAAHAVVQAAPADRSEPNVRYTVIEDDGSKIDELRVRGQLAHVIVTPKVGTTTSYEILLSRSGRDPVDGTGGANSAAGKRVWSVLKF